MTFQDIERRYAELDSQYRGGTLTAEQFKAATATLMTKDVQGRWWTKRRGDGAWRVFDGTSWVAGNPYPLSVPQPTLAFAGAGAAVGAEPVAAPVMQPVAQPMAQPMAQPEAPPMAQPAAQAEPQAAPAGMGRKAILYYLLSIIPIFGLVLWASFRKSEEPAKRAIARTLGIIALCSFAIGMALNVLVA